MATSPGMKDMPDEDKHKIDAYLTDMMNKHGYDQTIHHILDFLYRRTVEMKDTAVQPAGTYFDRVSFDELKRIVHDIYLARKKALKRLVRLMTSK